MEFFTKKGNIKKIIILIIAIILFNAFAPMYHIYADDAADEAFGGKLFRPLFKMLAAIGDLVINGLQKMFLGEASIRSGNTYIIKYGPAAIFSNTVPGLDANFINPIDNRSVFVPVEGSRYVPGDTDYGDIFERMSLEGDIVTGSDWWNNEMDDIYEGELKDLGFYNERSVQLYTDLDASDFLDWNDFEKFTSWISGLGFIQNDEYRIKCWYENDTAYVMVFIIARTRIWCH